MRAIRSMLPAALAVLIAAVFLAGLGSVSRPAVAAPVQDRVCEPPAAGAFALTDAPGNDPQAAQVFISGLSGPLARVSFFGAQNGLLQDVVVELRNATLQGGQFLPGDTVLATATVPASAISIGPRQWFDATFAAPATVTADQFYAAVINPRATAGQSSLLEIAGRSGCTLGGAAAGRGPSFNNDMWTVLVPPLSLLDAFSFRSFVDVVGSTPSSSPSTSPPASPPASSPAPKPGLPAPGPTATPGPTPNGTTKPGPATLAPAPPPSSGAVT